ncbi:MAG TPA: SurA N-terminal domain-containing protein [Rhodopseudomonas sp.]|uniref:SurA N-terminal domain-containing protein n=1 Tax=Rhodopseudomonas sp. TaxID=1078 RepID=UPI002ED77328
MTARPPLRLFHLALCCAIALLAIGRAPEARAQTVAVMVNGEPITNYDIEQRSKLMALSTHKSPSRQEVIDELINEKVKIREGKKFGIDPSASDIDGAFANMGSRMRMTPEALTKSLEAQGIRAETLRHRMRAEMVWTSLVRGRFKDSLLVGEKEVQAAVGGDDKTQGDSFEYQMRPIVLIVPRTAAPAARELRMKEAEALRNRVQSCEEANDLFKSMQNAAIRDTVTKTSADIPQVLREVLDKTPIGHLTAPEVTKQGVEMVALCARKPTTADTPKKREIRDKMFAEKFDAKSKSYLRDVRKAAMIEYR